MKVPINCANIFGNKLYKNIYSNQSHQLTGGFDFKACHATNTFHKIYRKVFLMKDYKDIIAQLKYPGVSKCMSEIYESTNMDDIQYSQNQPVVKQGQKTNEGIS